MKPVAIAMPTGAEILHQLLCKLAAQVRHIKNTTFYTTQGMNTGVIERKPMKRIFDLKPIKIGVYRRSKQFGESGEKGEVADRGAAIAVLRRNAGTFKMQ